MKIIKDVKIIGIREETMLNRTKEQSGNLKVLGTASNKEVNPLL